MMKRLLCSSMMCANFANLQEDTKALDEAGIDIFHIDIMDGIFVPNFAMGLQDLQLIRSSTKKKVDVHLMIENPGNYVDLFSQIGVDIIYIHPEADKQYARTLDMIKSKGMKAGVAINPGTSLDTIKEIFSLIDYLMIMTVNPGFAGQKYLDYVNPKIEEAVSYGKLFSFNVMVDGALSPQRIEELHAVGVTGFVLGTSALFGKEKSYKEIVKELGGQLV
ncbi:ribulose-phosphate 3-epimerase [Enterococcus sp. BWT-B8]|uniref:ribulose-phosphate 3-epimerase n=1 Tax=unclassified Enterococcus TaxID=2608891 RepID=UPI001E475924|nr:MULTISPECIES: ribulose-phosphate 3-epimerase [unclassified Enterococcus]MCB5952403.1 ribulose-phosphate 3-epimerase [Enterococcus sp. BWT-B8]MCB5955357.1 ribulose-phosphate 3-epimerase [Enterococcus sp. CWB-B31]